MQSRRHFLTVTAGLAGSGALGVAASRPASQEQPDGPPVAWERRYDQPVNLTDVVAIGGGFVLSGGTGANADPSGDGWLGRVDAEGELDWQATDDHEGWNDYRNLALGPGGPVAAGLSNATDGSFVQARTIDGDARWDAVVGADADADVLDVARTVDGVAVAGQTYSTASDSAVWAAGLGDGGEVRWTFEADPSDSLDSAYALCGHPDGGVVLGGRMPGGDGGAAFLARVDASGTEQWRRRPEADTTDAVARTSDGFLVGGAARSGDGLSPALLSVDRRGQVQWRRSYQTDTQVGFVSEVAPLADGGAVIVGSVGTPTEFRPWVARTDAEGGRRWERKLSAAGGLGNAVAVSSGGITVAGRREEDAGPVGALVRLSEDVEPLSQPALGADDDEDDDDDASASGPTGLGTVLSGAAAAGATLGAARWLSNRD
jgi:hypothetical protein